MGKAGPAIGYACLWDERPERTWSHAPWMLRTAMQPAGDVFDLGLHVPRTLRTALKALHTHRSGGRWVTTWSYSRLTDAYVGTSLRRAVDKALAAGHCDAVLTIQDLASLQVPFFAYQDLSFDALAAIQDCADERAALLSISAATIARRRERQHEIYEKATGVIAMTRWLANDLITRTGLPAHKVHVVHPGVNSGPGPVTEPAAEPGSAVSLPRLRPAPRRRLLFVGGDFYRKGGDLAVGALTRLRRDYDPRITLTVAGPRSWPLDGEPPEGVRFLGALSPSEVLRLYDEHDLLVVPSRVEPFGLVFAEAISHGMPCVARNAFAMPEVVVPGKTGVLVDPADHDPANLAAAIATALGDDALYAACRDVAPATREHFSWERAGREMVSVITSVLSGVSQGEQNRTDQQLSELL